LLSIKKDTEMAIVEMGANHKGEIAFLCSLAQPDYGYITNFGKAHLEGFGGVQGVIEGKSELYTYLKKNGKHIFFNEDDDTQTGRIGNYKEKSGYGTENDSLFRVRLLHVNPFVKMECLEQTITTRLVGSYNFNNCAAAALLGNYFQVSAKDIKLALEGYLPQNNRSQLIEKEGYRILLDAYNANPTSMNAALENFRDMKNGPKTVFLGDMFELGDSAPKEHQTIADLVADMGFKTVYLIGENFSGVDTPLKTFKDFREFEAYIREYKPSPGSILIKGSRGMALERILDSL
jgi:UDP-N-acetylmuramoyl-tripeptide--D-alanyl-D-alanine ligase